MEHNSVLGIIIELIKAVKANDYIEDNGVKLSNASYLLGQVLRQYNLPLEHYFVSEKAAFLWKSLTSKNIMRFYYRDKILCDKAEAIEVKKYVGNCNSFTTKIINKGETIIYRDVFHDEHIVPINIIIKELCSLKELNVCSVKTVIDKIRICKILKEEDKKIKNKRNRSSDYQIALSDNYVPAGIVCLDAVMITKK